MPTLLVLRVGKAGAGSVLEDSGIAGLVLRPRGDGSLGTFVKGAMESASSEASRAREAAALGCAGRSAAGGKGKSAAGSAGAMLSRRPCGSVSGLVGRCGGSFFSTL